MRFVFVVAIAIGVICVAGVHGVAQATALQVAPVLVEIAPPAATGQLTLRNSGDSPLSAQVRVFRWVQEQGADRLVETRDVVASPPIVEIQPRSEQLVRIVRLAKTTSAIEDSYRLLVDEIPSGSNSRSTAVNFAIRYSVPVFFGDRKLASSPLVWTVQQRGATVIVSASNSGTRRERIAALQLKSDRGEAKLSKGLVGYVLAQSTASWTFSVRLDGFKIGEQVKISAHTDEGPITASAILQGAK